MRLALTFTHHAVIEGRMGCKFIWGEVTELNGENRTATILMLVPKKEVIDFDYCVIAAGCKLGVFHKWGDSLWFPPSTHWEVPLSLLWALVSLVWSGWLNCWASSISDHSALEGSGILPKYMLKKGIKQFYGNKYNAKEQDFWDKFE
jgi:hypothetical protein